MRFFDNGWNLCLKVGILDDDIKIYLRHVRRTMISRGMYITSVETVICVFCRYWTECIIVSIEIFDDDIESNA